MMFILVIPMVGDWGATVPRCFLVPKVNDSYPFSPTPLHLSFQKINANDCIT